jgi:menaquinone-dependent protoporphyrinogen IX oxidase
MKRILVAYYSLGGNTGRIAKDLAARLGADILQIRELAERRGLLGYLGAALDSLRERSALLARLGKSAGDYDLVLVGTPVWAGRITPAARTYLKTLRGQARHVAFFSTSGGTDVARLVPAMQQLVGQEALASVGFTQAELRDAEVCARKLDSFVAALRTRAPSPRLAAEAPEHALA